MAIQTKPETIIPAPAELDNVSKQGWERFTKFLFGNVVVVIVLLLIIGALTVWS